MAELCRAAVTLELIPLARSVQHSFRALQDAIKRHIDIVWDPKGIFACLSFSV